MAIVCLGSHAVPLVNEDHAPAKGMGVLPG